MGTDKVSNETPPRKNRPALDFKSATLYAIRVVLHAADTATLVDALRKRMSDAGAFFENEPVVVDATGIDEVIDWPTLLAALREHRLHPVGVIATGDQQEAARDAGLVAVDAGSPPVRPTATPSPDHDVPAAAIIPENAGKAADAGSPPQADAAGDGKAAPSALAASGAEDAPGPEASGGAQPAPAPAAMIINRPLRSGQRVYARDTDLIVIGVVSRGAEVIADGNVHVYGPLRGKAMAGARGDASARIFTTQLDPELVAIAGVYRVIETQLDAALQNKPAIIHLSGDSLQFESLGN
ncbi:septum site-determining protein MinC [Alcaligenaceae bacterium]|nr:septum site-determining protein MinC [Alcaligenaceae bacterium]